MLPRVTVALIVVVVFVDNALDPGQRVGRSGGSQGLQAGIPGHGRH